MATAQRLRNGSKLVPGYDRYVTFKENVVMKNGVRQRADVVPGSVLEYGRSHDTYVKLPDTIQLTLTLDEAATLAIIGYSTGGHPDGRRGDVTAITRALAAAGVSFNGGIHAHPDVEVPLRFRNGRVPQAAGLSTNGETPVSPVQGGKAASVLQKAAVDPCANANPVPPQPTTRGVGEPSTTLADALYRDAVRSGFYNIR